jgi:glycogen debranching enzyme
MARYGFFSEASQLMNGLFNACLFIDLHRLPELFCGFPCRHGEPPTAYPVACVPQAWSVASVFLLVQSCLQLTVDAPGKTLFLDNPQLPSYLKTLTIKNLKVEEGIFNLQFTKHENDVGIVTLSKPDDWKIIVSK